MLPCGPLVSPHPPILSGVGWSNSMGTLFTFIPVVIIHCLITFGGLGFIFGVLLVLLY